MTQNGKKNNFIAISDNIFCDKYPKGFYASLMGNANAYAIFNKTITEIVYNGWLRTDIQQSAKLAKCMTVHLKEIGTKEVENKTDKEMPCSKRLNIEKMKVGQLNATILNLLRLIENTKNIINKLHIVSHMYNLLILHMEIVNAHPNLKNVSILKLHEIDGDLQCKFAHLWNSPELCELEKKLNKKYVCGELGKKEEDKMKIIYNILTEIFNPKEYIQFFANPTDPEFIKRIDKNALQKYIDDMSHSISNSSKGLTKADYKKILMTNPDLV